MSHQDMISMGIFKSITAAITKSDDLQEMVEYLCALLTDALDLKGCAIFLLDEEQTELQLSASAGLSADYLLKGPLNPKKSLGSTIKGEAMIITDAWNDTRMQYPQQARSEGIQTLIEVPVKCLDTIVGSFRLYQSFFWEISEQDLDSLYVLGELIGMAISYMDMSNALLTVREITSSVRYSKSQLLNAE